MCFRVIRAFPIYVLIAASLLCSAKAQTIQKQSAIRIDNFGRIDDQYYRGSQPRDKDYHDLAILGIRSIITLTSIDTDPNEKAIAEKLGMKYYQIPMESHTPPTTAQVAEFLQIVNDASNQPVYVHCAAGKHRTGVMTAIYRLTKHHWTADQAYNEMKKFKFGPSLFHSQLKRFVYEYYQKLTAAITVTNVD
jgi:protein tyrosine/serine phosphatase